MKWITASVVPDVGAQRCRLNSEGLCYACLDEIEAEEREEEKRR